MVATQRLALTGLHLGDVAHVQGRRRPSPGHRSAALSRPGGWPRVRSRKPRAAATRASLALVVAGRETRLVWPRSSSSLIATKSSSIAVDLVGDALSCLRSLPSPRRSNLSIKATEVGLPVRRFLTCTVFSAEMFPICLARPRQDPSIVEAPAARPLSGKPGLANRWPLAARGSF